MNEIMNLLGKIEIEKNGSFIQMKYCHQSEKEIHNNTAREKKKVKKNKTKQKSENKVRKKEEQYQLTLYSYWLQRNGKR